MCGIHGFNWSNDSQIKKMVKSASQRGPDGDGIYVDDSISIGHNLLAITENAKLSKQPWKIGDRYILSYNGEIYNYKDIQNNLEQKGYKFKTDSDTEVLAVGLAEYGPELLDTLDGMYAIAWYDKQTGTVMLARDHAGVKPLYYMQYNGKLIFSSSINSIKKIQNTTELDVVAFQLFMNFGYVPGPKTLYDEIKKITPGESIIFGVKDGKVKKRSIVKFSIDQNQQFDPAEFRDKVSTSVRQCLMGKRPIGLFLSGGLDSSAILHELAQYDNKPKTFTTRFDCGNCKKADDFFNSDANIAKRLSEHYNTDHTELCVSMEDFMDAIEPCYSAIEEPRYNRNSPVYYLMNKEIARQGIVVTLAGDGGDEIFTGYSRHPKIPIHKKGKNQINHAIGDWHHLTRFVKNLNSLYTWYNRHLKWHIDDAFLVDYMGKWLPDSLFGNDSVNNYLAVESLTVLPEDFLIRNDQLGMNFSMEGRFPLTTKMMKEYALGISSSVKMIEHETKLDFSPRQIQLNPKKQKKHVIKDIKRLPKTAYDGHMPDYVINKFKTGWSIPDDRSTFSWWDSEDFNEKWVYPVMGKPIDGAFWSITSSDYYTEVDKLFDPRMIFWEKQSGGNFVLSKFGIGAFFFKVWAKQNKITVAGRSLEKVDSPPVTMKHWKQAVSENPLGRQGVVPDSDKPIGKNKTAKVVKVNKID